MNASATNLFHPLRYWSDSPEGFPAIDAVDAAADREDSLSERYAFQLGEYQGIHRLKAPVEWPHNAMEKGYSYGLTRQAAHADVYLRKLLGLVDDNYLGRRIDSSVLLPALTRCLT